MLAPVARERAIVFSLILGVAACVGLPGQTRARGGTENMAIREIRIERSSVVSTRPFDKVVNDIDEQIGHPDMAAFRRSLTMAQNEAELEQAVHAVTGPTDLMEFARYDLGEVIRKETGAATPRVLRLVVGNPLIMKQLVKAVPDAGSYAPVTILIDERADGVHISYDRMASYLAPYGNAEALKVARDLDAKVEALLIAAAR